MKIARVLLALTVISPAICSVNILRPDGEVCLGSAATFTCTVNGNILGWRYGGVGSAPELYVNPSGSTTLRSLESSPFNTSVISVSGGVITSIATTSNLTRDTDGMTLECSDGSFTSDTTEIENVTLPLENSSPATSAFSSFDPVGAQINVTLSGATCIRLYSVRYWVSIINEGLDAIDRTAVTTGTSFFYKPQYPGFYSFQVNSINYFGEDLGSIPTLPSISYPWLAPTTFISVEFVDSIGLIVSFKDDNIGQPPVNLCIITLNNDSRPCQLNETYTFPIIDGVNYTYNVTVGNVVGSINETGDVLDLMIRPTTVLIFMTETVIQAEVSAIGDPVVFAVPFIVLGVLIILIGFWIVLRICWKRQCCCPRIWRSSFWLIFFCYDYCTYDAEEKEENTIGLKNPNVGGEKGTDTSL